MDIGSPPSHGKRDEVIADSEEEEYAKSLTGVLCLALLVNICRINYIHLSAPSTIQQLHTNAVSSISDFTTIAFTSRSDAIVSPTIADRAKTRQRTQGTKKRPVIHRDDDIIELTSEDDVVEKGTKSSAQSVKPKPKVKVKVKMADNPLPSVIANPHIDAIDSEQPRPRVRPRPRPVVKQARPKLDSLPPHQYPFARDSFVYDMPAIRPPPISTPIVPYHGQPDLPIATSPATLNNALGPGMASHLPPSDPPNSSNTTGIGDALPPIEILQDGESERDGDSCLLSPSSLFSDSGPKSKAKKRKRGIALDILENEHEVDQLMPSSSQRLEPTPHVGITILDAYTHGPEPPPTFFAGSSSAGQYVGQCDSNAFPNLQADFIDLTDLPPTICYAKPSKPKKIKVNTEINRTGDMSRDEGDSDFKPSGRKSAKKKKGKGKEPVQEKEDKPKAKKGRSRKKKEQMDGVILQAKDKTGKTKSKGKQNEKEVFKSREIINDSDDENDPLLLVEGMQVARMPLTSTAEGVSLSKISDLNAGGLSSASGKFPSPKVNEPNSSAVGSKAKMKLKGKKRKSIESDEEGSEKGNEIQDCIVVKRRKSASGAPVPDEVEQERVDEKKNIQESACNGKDKPGDEAGDRAKPTSGARQDKTKDSKRTNEQKGGKVGAFCSLTSTSFISCVAGEYFRSFSLLCCKAVGRSGD